MWPVHRPLLLPSLWEEDERRPPSRLDWDRGLCRNLEVGNRFRGQGRENRRREFDGL